MKPGLVNPVPESNLIRRLKAGEVDAFEPLYRTHVGRVYATCLRLTGDASQAEELTQDVFVRCWEKIASFRGDAAFGTWLYRLSVNVVLEHFRSTKRREARIDFVDDCDVVNKRAVEQHSDYRLDLDVAIAALPRQARAVFVLHDIEGYKHEEIADLMGLAPGTLRSQLCRARRLLMETLSK